MDEQTRDTLGHLVEAVEALAESIWHVTDLRKPGNEQQSRFIATLAENRADIVKELLNRAKAAAEGA